ncbi:MAG: hypothetical protein ABI119_11590 [Gemmatimonadaceae bacterium]
MFDLYPRNSHRTPQQIAEDAGGSFEPRAVGRKTNGVRAAERTRPKLPTEADAKVTESPSKAR